MDIRWGDFKKKICFENTYQTFVNVAYVGITDGVLTSW